MSFTVSMNCVRLSALRLVDVDVLRYATGDYYHGNPRKYSADEFNKRCKKTMGELYETTCKRRKTIEGLGFKYEEIWEDELHAAKTLLLLSEAKA